MFPKTSLNEQRMSQSELQWGKDAIQQELKWIKGRAVKNRVAFTIDAKFEMIWVNTERGWSILYWWPSTHLDLHLKILVIENDLRSEATPNTSRILNEEHYMNYQCELPSYNVWWEELHWNGWCATTHNVGGNCIWFGPIRNCKRGWCTTIGLQNWYNARRMAWLGLWVKAVSVTWVLML